MTDLLQMTPEQIALEVLLPAIGNGSRPFDRARSTVARLLGAERSTSLGRELDIEAQAAIDWLIVNGYLTRDPQQGTGAFLTLTRKGRERASS